MTIAAGTLVGSYKILSPLGAGGMGEVYLAEDTRLRRKVALKVLPDSLAQDKDRLRRFEQEAFAASALNHPNILTIHEFGAASTEAGEMYFLAAEFIDGETLRARLERAPLTLNEALDIAIQTTQALAAAHEANIIHRDIKPENVMLRKDGIVKVLDFGLAKLIEPAQLDPEAETRKLGLTQAGTVMGTVAYMSPEQARGKTVDARTDLFSLGVMLYEMLTRRQPFTGETLNHVIVAILEQEPPPLAPEVPAELTRILTQMLAKRVDERYASAQAMLTDLKKLQKRLEYEAEHPRAASSEDEQTLMLKPTTTAATEAKGTSAENAQPTAPNQPKTRKTLVAALLSLVALVGGYFGYHTFMANQPIASIAVLPFENRSGNADSEYLSDGLAESLIYRLSQLPNLKVSPTSSVFRYKGKETDPLKVGAELGVQAVMAGRMTQRGEHLTISVELVDVRHNKTLWGEQYERKLSELLATQREIAAEIINKLQLKLSGEGAQKLTRKYTDSNEAYQLYLKGRYHTAKRTRNDVNKGLEYFQQAVEIDAYFALAYAMIADSYSIMAAYPYLSPGDALPKSKAAANKALEIDPTLSEAHMALAVSLGLYDWKWDEADRAFRRSLELDPNNSLAHVRYGIGYLSPQGRLEESVRELERAVELEPLNLINGANLGWVYMLAGRKNDALVHGRKVFDLEPEFILGRYLLGLTYLANGMDAEALDLTRKPLESDPTNQMMLQVAGCAYAKLGRRKEAESVTAKFTEIAKTQYVMSFYVVTIYALLGENDKAFEELERGYRARDWRMSALLKIEPLIEPLRGDPRYRDLLRRMNLPE
jgi:serine/threonine-protein kinase